jgi:hypothetical protein
MGQVIYILFSVCKSIHTRAGGIYHHLIKRLDTANYYIYAQLTVNRDFTSSLTPAMMACFRFLDIPMLGSQMKNNANKP